MELRFPGVPAEHLFKYGNEPLVENWHGSLHRDVVSRKQVVRVATGFGLSTVAARPPRQHPSEKVCAAVDGS
jgi:hypothetical protein